MKVSIEKDTQAILLLCGVLGNKQDEFNPLNLKEYNLVTDWLKRQDLAPGDLVDSNRPWASDIAQDIHALKETRIGYLLNRGVSMALALEKWMNNGLWVIGRGESGYPKRLKRLLGISAPPLLFGVGNRENLDIGGLCVVGSRSIDDEAREFARNAAKRAARNGLQIISGGAKGIDSEAMGAALEDGGKVLGVLAENLFKTAVNPNFHDYFLEGKLTLITPYNPEAPFNVGNAMGRNRYLYTLSDGALVVQADLERGGTWSGAVENLRNHWVPMWVRLEGSAQLGNQKLVKMGASKIMSDGLEKLMEEAAKNNSFAGVNTHNLTELYNPAANESAQKYGSNSGEKVFDLVWPLIKKELMEPKTLKELSVVLDILPKQMEIWLKIAVKEHIVVKTKKPAKYLISEIPKQDQLNLV